MALPPQATLPTRFSGLCPTLRIGSTPGYRLQATGPRSQAGAQGIDPNIYYRLSTEWRGENLPLDIINGGTDNNRPILAPKGDFSGQLWKLTPVPATVEPRGQLVKLQSFNYPGHYLRHQAFRLKLQAKTPDELFLKDATFMVVPGLADPAWISLQSVNHPGRLLRHRLFQVWLDEKAATEPYLKDATFKIIEVK